MKKRYLSAQEARKKYSEYIHNKAALWGLPEIPGRPLIADGNPYVEEPIPLDEILSPDFNNGSTIGLFYLNGFWGYTLDINLTWSGVSYNALLKFCKPYPTRRDALEAAVAKVLEWIHREFSHTQEDDILIARLDKWARSLVLHQRLPLL